jgi:hypothetical protein
MPISLANFPFKVEHSYLKKVLPTIDYIEENRASDVNISLIRLTQDPLDPPHSLLAHFILELNFDPSFPLEIQYELLLVFACLLRIV